MEFSLEKCKVMQGSNQGMYQVIQQVNDCERDLGVLVLSDENCHEKVNSVASKANMVLGLMKNTFSSWSDEIYKTYDDNNILKPNQQADHRTHPFQLSRKLTKGNKPRIHILLNRMDTSWNNLPKN